MIRAMLLILVTSAPYAAASTHSVAASEVKGTYMGLISGSVPIWVRFEEEKRGATTDLYELPYTMILPTEVREGTARVIIKGSDRTIAFEGFTATLTHEHGVVCIKSAMNAVPTLQLDRVAAPAAAGAGCGGECRIRVSWQMERTLGDQALQTIVALKEKLAPKAQPNFHPFQGLHGLVDNAIAQAQKPAPAPVVITKMDPRAEEWRTELETARARLQKLEQDESKLKTERDAAQEAARAAESKLATLENARPTHHYTVMPYQDLMLAKMVERHRFIFRTGYRLTALPADVFQPVPADQENELILPYRMKRLTILSPHPRQSYDLVPVSFERTKLKIHDSASFWTMPYLVIGVQ